ncbi:fibrobacter succinogenes major paralogous domain-containing protein [Candidatus Saccharibacteria bacterium]|nr:fibrobacter succinogenes major paralogous domain-containing protein [Candidatus Saccharibacteria bacterium]
MLAVGDIITLPDARDNTQYRIKKMPDNKCWMMDNLAYTGGGDNTYGDVVPAFSGSTPTTSSTGVLIEHPGGGDWPVGGSNANRQTVRQFANNSSAGFNNTSCLPDTPTGTGVMQSICGDQVLYNFCAAMGLDDSTTPTCSAVSNTTTGTNMASTGVVGATGSGIGGESLGSGGTSICPAGWRIPVGRVGASNDSNNEWAILSGAFNTGGTNLAPNTSTDAGFMGYWQPAGTSVGSGGIQLGGGAFGTVSAGSVTSAAGDLNGQSSYAYWWTSSLSSATNAWDTAVNSTNVNPGTNGNNKAAGFTVRCVYP